MFLTSCDTLTTIRAYRTLLEGALDKRNIPEFSKGLNSESERMTRLVKDLLQLSKLIMTRLEWIEKS